MPEVGQGPGNLGSSVETYIKNNMILNVAMWVTLNCYGCAFIPLAFDNDAGAFFTDCLTMWTMYVYFYKDEAVIQYSYIL